MSIYNYDNFLNESTKPQYRLWIDDDPSMIQDNVDWDLVLDFNDIWNKYSNKEIDINGFISNYKLKINEYKQNIIDSKGINSWNDLVNILNDFKDIEKSHSKFDEVYDWADKNNIEIKVK